MQRVPGFRAIEAAGVVGVGAELFVPVEQGLVQDFQRFVGARVLANVLVADQDILAGSAVGHPSAEPRREVDGLPLDGLADLRFRRGIDAFTPDGFVVCVVIRKKPVPEPFHQSHVRLPGCRNPP